MREVEQRHHDTDVSRGDDTLWVAIVAVASVVLLLARAPFAVSRFWAEDGVVFFQGARQEGISAFGDFWAGYYHLIPRATGAITASVPVSAAPYVNWAIIAICIAWCAVTVFVASRTWVATLAGRLLLAAGVVLLPSLGRESIANIANLHFIMLFPTLMVLISKPRSRAEGVNGAVFVILATLSTLQTVVLAPVVAYRIWTNRPRRIDVLSALWIAGTVAHLVAIFVAKPDRPQEAAPSLFGVARSFGKGVLAENFAPTTAAAVVTGTVLALALGFFIVKSVLVTYRAGDMQRAVWLVLVPASGVLLYIFLGVRLGYTTPRYAVFPAMCLTWSVVEAAEILIPRLDPGQWIRRLGGVSLVCVLLVVVWLPHWKVDTYRSQGSSWATTLDEAEARCEATGADSVEMEIPPSSEGQRLWPVEVQCDELG
jgi:hypothetical protein